MHETTIYNFVSFCHAGIMATSDQSSCSKYREDILQNRHYFPAFRDLGEDNDLDLRYWQESSFGCYECAYTWCFVAEIVNDELSQIPFLRNRVNVRDRNGQDNINISFYPESGTFNFRTLKRGHTICVIQAQQHYFLDMSIGLRIECLDSVKVIPCGLSDLFALSKHYSQNANSCWECGKANDEESSLKKCAACKVACYCDKQCQTKDWKERHRVWCKAIPEFLKLTKIDYSKYTEDSLTSVTGQRLW